MIQAAAVSRLGQCTVFCGRMISRPITGDPPDRSRRSLARQTRGPTQAGRIRVFADKLPGKTAHRPELAACLDYLRAGDTLVVPRLAGDRHGQRPRREVGMNIGEGRSIQANGIWPLRTGLAPSQRAPRARARRQSRS